jgi:hypothetical protein
VLRITIAVLYAAPAWAWGAARVMASRIALIQALCGIVFLHVVGVMPAFVDEAA